MNRQILILAVLVLALVGGVPGRSGAADPAVPAMEFVQEIDIQVSGPRDVTYYVWIYPFGAGNLSRGSQLIGFLPPKTFNFAELYNELSILPQSNDMRAPYVYHFIFVDKRYIKLSQQEREAKGYKRAEGNIQDTKVGRKILEAFKGPANPIAKEALKAFSETPPFPP